MIPRTTKRPGHLCLPRIGKASPRPGRICHPAREPRPRLRGKTTARDALALPPGRG